MCTNLHAEPATDSCDLAGAALEQARDLLKATSLIDGRNDLPWVIREETDGDVEA